MTVHVRIVSFELLIIYNSFVIILGDKLML